MKCPFLQNYTNDDTFTDVLSKKSNKGPCKYADGRCVGSLMNQKPRNSKPLDQNEILQKAEEFLEEFYDAANNNSEKFSHRMERVKQEIEGTGTYELTKEELEFGAATAWRNASRCPARVIWRNLKLLDHRDVDTPDKMFDAILDHIQISFNGGKIKPAITVFRKRKPGLGDPRVWNGLGISYAGYVKEDGSIIGDPGNVEFTQFCQSLGWKGKGGMFDYLPIIISGADGEPHWYQLPDDVVTRIPIRHQTNEAINSFNLEWFGLPFVTGLMLEVGGIQFPASPFSGWYTGAEIANRDLLDLQRYNLLKPIATRMGLDTNNNSNLWRDRVALDLNLAVLQSYQNAGVTIVDHFTQSDQFLAHMKSEYQTRGGCPADWVWIVPPQSGSLVTSYHQEMVNYHLSPAYEYQERLWDQYGRKETSRKSLRSVAWTLLLWNSIYKRLMIKRQKVTIFYGTETGTSKRFAQLAQNLLRTTFNSSIVPINNNNIINIVNGSRAVLFITSTFGNGEPPTMAIDFNKMTEDLIENMKDDVCFLDEEYEKTELSKNMKFAVFALGSSAYPNFAAYGKHLDNCLHILGGQRLTNVGVGDELGNQEGTFTAWLQHFFLIVCQELSVKTNNLRMAEAITMMRSMSVQETDNSSYRWRMMDQRRPLCKTLSSTHKVNVEEMILTRRDHLHEVSEVGSSILVSLTPSSMKSEYEPGDHLGIIPSNTEEDIAFVKKHLESCPPLEYPVALEQKEGNDHPWLPNEDYPKGLTLQELLHYYVDFRSTPTQSLLRLLSRFSKLEKEKDHLLQLGSNFDDYKKWKTEFEPNILDTFKLFPSVKVCSASLISHVPVTRPRRYSIASTAAWEGVDVCLVVGVVDYKHKMGSRRFGLASGNLCNSPLGSKMMGFLRSETGFRLPEDTQKDVVLIAAGSGIAPFRGFWMKRAEQYNKGLLVGKTILYFGCRNNKMNLLKDETDLLERSGMDITRKTALSQEPGVKRQYVQELILEDSSDLFRMIRDGAAIYVCGKVSMAQAVQEAIIGLLQQYLRLDKEAAQHSILRMKKEKLYQEDIFG